MKKITLSVTGDGEKARSALDALSGVVAADTVGTTAYAYAGDRLSDEALIVAVENAGCHGAIVNTEYLSDVNAVNESIKSTI